MNTKLHCGGVSEQAVSMRHAMEHWNKSIVACGWYRNDVKLTILQNTTVRSVIAGFLFTLISWWQIVVSKFERLEDTED